MIDQETQLLLNKINQVLSAQPKLSLIAHTSLKDLLYQLENLDAENFLQLKKIADLKSEKFYVASYQRGYKWKPQQVRDLLEDIETFIPNEQHTNFYCLQPVVVKAFVDEGKAYWELIDGQQRMTTIFMILRYLQKQPFFELNYATRLESSHFLHEILPKEVENTPDLTWEKLIETYPELDHIDHYYFFNAYQTIMDWFAEDEEKKKRWSEKLLQYTKIIWYMVASKAQSYNQNDSIKIFTRLNQGKIALTDAELIKALLLQKIIKEYPDTKLAQQKQLELANQWDMVEAQLNETNFWAFLNAQQQAKAFTRIEFIFELIAQKNAGMAQGTNSTFNYFVAYFQNNPYVTVEQVWKEVLQGFYRLQEWYQDIKIYHRVGFIIHRKITTIHDLWKKANLVSRREFNQLLDEMIQNKIYKIFAEQPTAQNKNPILDFDAVAYQETTTRADLITLFMLFDAHLHEMYGTKLSFKHYSQTKWDIEHIHATNTHEHNLSPENRQEAYLHHQALIQALAIEPQQKQNLQEKLQTWVQSTEQLQSHWEAYTRVLDPILGIGHDFELSSNSLDNLCLLPHQVNRAIGKKYFFIKRQIILNTLYKKQHFETITDENIFIPLLTQHIFSKTFSDNVSQMYQWSLDEDRQKYRNAFIKCLSRFNVNFG